MIEILIKDILPIFVIMFLGYAAGKRGVFSTSDSKILNKLVLTYALPAALFVSIVKADRQMLFDDLKLTIISFVVITALFLWSYFSCYKFFKHTKSEAAVCALIAGSPTIGFLGFAVLEPIYGATATTGLVVAIVSIVVNAINIPIGLALLNNGNVLKIDNNRTVTNMNVTNGVAVSGLDMILTQNNSLNGIDNIEVIPEYRGKGIGTKLMSYLISMIMIL